MGLHGKSKGKRRGPGDDGPTTDVWVCLKCGLAFPSDHREMVLGAGGGGTGNFHFHAQGGNGQVTRVGRMFARAAETLCGPRYKRVDAPALEPPPRPDPLRLPMSEIQAHRDAGRATGSSPDAGGERTNEAVLGGYAYDKRPW